MTQKEKQIKYRGVKVSDLFEGDMFVKYDAVGASPKMYEITLNFWAHNDAKARDMHGVIIRIPRTEKVWVPVKKQKGK